MGARFARGQQPPPGGVKIRLMLQEVAIGQKSLATYESIVGRETTERILELAAPLRGKRVLHVSATAFGGGVSEILYTIVPLMRDVGIGAHWHVIFGQAAFFSAP